MLVGNGCIFGRNPGRLLGGSAIGGGVGANLSLNPANWIKLSFMNARFAGAMNPKYGVPSTYRHPAAWLLPMKAGTLGSVNEMVGEGSLSFVNLAGGKAASADLAGVGDISNAALGLILSAVAALAGVGGVSADIRGVLQAAADLAGTSDVVTSLGALSSMVAALTGEGAIDATARADAYMSADITPFTELSPQTLAAAVWNAVAANLNDPDSMGRRLNEIYKIHGLDPANPLVVNSGTRTAGPDISQTIVDDAGEVTVTRT